MTENPRHREFARRIVWHRDTAAEAYRRAGFKAKGTSAQTSGAHKTLKLPSVQAMIEEERARLAEHLAVEEEHIVQELAGIAFADITEVIDWAAQHIQVTDDDTPAATITVRDTADIPAHVRRCIKTFKAGKTGITLEFHDKLGALAHLAKIKGMMVDKAEISGAGGGPIETRADFSDLIGAFQAAGHGGNGTNA